MTSYVTCAVTPGGALIEVFANAVPLSPPLACKSVDCAPVINGPPESVTPKCPLSVVIPWTVTLSAVLGVTTDNIIAVELKLRCPVIEMV